MGDNTRMVCDASACFGQEVDLSSASDLKLSTIIPTAKAGSKIQAPVTAWTTMAAERAKSLARTENSFTEAVEQARAEVNLTVGFDVANTPARSITKLDNATAEEVQAAVMNAVVAELVFNDQGEIDLEKLDSFTSALEDGKIDKNSDGFAPTELAEKIESVVDDLDLNEEPPELNNLKERYKIAGDSVIPPFLTALLSRG